MDDSAQALPFLTRLLPSEQLALPIALPPPPSPNTTFVQEIDALHEAVAQFMPKAIAGDTRACAVIGAIYDRIALIEGTHRHAPR